jgi:hypothetical protein
VALKRIAEAAAINRNAAGFFVSILEEAAVQFDQGVRRLTHWDDMWILVGRSMMASSVRMRRP